MHTFQDLIARWPTVAEFARDIDVGYEAARKMNERNNIRNEHWDAVMSAAKHRGIRLTADDLLRMSQFRRREAERKKCGRGSPRAVAA